MATALNVPPLGVRVTDDTAAIRSLLAALLAFDVAPFVTVHAATYPTAEATIRAFSVAHPETEIAEYDTRSGRDVTLRLRANQRVLIHCFVDVVKFTHTWTALCAEIPGLESASRTWPTSKLNRAMQFTAGASWERAKAYAVTLMDGAK